ncbi:hypothetical protein RUM43_007225 [Polyplax serrata]|uniref:Thrombospondin-like N-terminal domain-containing protein n=1 Tax=Polyplax serrata TaxID=468196 RepID=A0AAN8S5C2_POLSC
MCKEINNSVYKERWENWSDWGTCSSSCGEGSQERSRRCSLKEKSCHGYNKERRRCNMFSCQGAVDPMRLDDRRFFHPSRGEWQRVASRPTAWKLRPNSYVWVPSSQIFANKSTAQKPGVFPREFSLLVTLKLSPKKPMRGILFSLRSRREQNGYLSLELEAPDRIRVVHAGKNGTQAVIIPMKLNDGHWHQLGIALQDDNSVRSFLDCAWVSTDILKRNELDHPEDADLIIGYLFQGELEQLMIVPNPGAVAQQCSSTKIPIYDPTIPNEFPTAPTRRTVRKKNDESGGSEKRHTTHAGFQFLDYGKDILKGGGSHRARSESSNSVLDEDVTEGSGNGNESSFNRTKYDVEWSEWSSCSSTCGPGLETRYSRCVDDGSQLELCLEAGNERTETRSCMLKACEEFFEKEFPTDSERATSSGDLTGTGSVSTRLDLTAPSNPIETNSSGTSKRLTDEIFFPSDMYFIENHTVVAKKHIDEQSQVHNRRVTSNKSWDMLKKRLFRENGK